jgi:hypothetical protein
MKTYRTNLLGINFSYLEMEKNSGGSCPSQSWPAYFGHNFDHIFDLF